MPESLTRNVTIYDDLPSQSLHYSVTEIKPVERDKGAYYHPFYPVYLSDKDTNETYIVPALYVKLPQTRQNGKKLNVAYV